MSMSGLKHPAESKLILGGVEHASCDAGGFHSDSSLARLIEKSPFIGVFDIDDAGAITSANQAGTEMLLRADAEAVVRASFDALAGVELADAIRGLLVAGEPRILRTIVQGWQLTITACTHTEDSGFTVLVQRRAGIIPQVIQGFEVEFLPFGSLGPLDQLSSREVEVAAWIGMGLSVRSIGQRLHRSVKTIENHRVAIGKKLGVSDRLDIALLAFQAGLRPADAALRRILVSAFVLGMTDAACLMF